MAVSDDVEKRKSGQTLGCINSCIWGEETPVGIVTKFRMWVGIHGMNCAKLGNDRLNGFGMNRGQISPFSVDTCGRP